MKIETSHAKICVSDSENKQSGVNINSRLSGYAADMAFWADAYLAKRKDSPFMHVILIPSKRWLKDLEDDGYEIIGLLSELTKNSITPSGGQ